MNRPMATKGTRAEVLLHIARQRDLGELMIGDHDRPQLKELAVTAALVLAVLFSNSHGWM